MMATTIIAATKPGSSTNYTVLSIFYLLKKKKSRNKMSCCKEKKLAKLILYNLKLSSFQVCNGKSPCFLCVMCIYLCDSGFSPFAIRFQQ